MGVKSKNPKLFFMVIDDNEDIGEAIKLVISLTDNNSIFFLKPY